MPRLLLITALGASLFAASCVGGPAPAPTAAPFALYAGGSILVSDGVDLWASAPDGSGRRRLTSDGSDTAPYLGGRWSPSGKLVAAERFLPGESGPQLFLVESGSGRRVSQPGTWVDGVGWSPDGGRLVYATITSGGTLTSGGSLAAETGEVRLLDVSAGTEKVVGNGVHASWSPDGTRIAYVHAAGAIATSAPDGSGMRWLATLADLDRIAAHVASKGFRLLGGPVWSRDGRRLAFSAIENGPIGDALQVIFVAGGTAPGAPLRPYSIGRTGALHHVVNLQWSPTADLLAYATIWTEPHHHVVGVIDPARDQALPLYDSAKHFYDYTWSPDGSHVLLEGTEERALIAVRVDRPDPRPRKLAIFGYKPDWCCPARAQSR